MRRPPVAPTLTSGAVLALFALLPVAPLGCAPHGRTVAATPTATASARPHLDAAQTFLARGETTAAVNAWRQALGVDPTLVEARTFLGLALYDLGDFDGAADELRTVLRQAPGASSARLALARALMARQDWAGARAELDAVLRTQPDRAEAYYSLGVVRYATGDLSGAIEAYRRVVTLDPQQQQARYNLALVLRLAHRDEEATREFLAAAEGGVPRAQYFAGAAYAAGLGVQRNLPQAVRWWFRASDQGVEQADEALAQLRQVALGRARRSPAERQAAEQAFREFRAGLWDQYPGLTHATGDPAASDETVGGALLRQGRAEEAVPVLIVEALALSEPAQQLLVTLYERGSEGGLAPNDARILAYFKTATAEGLVSSGRPTSSRP